MMLADLPPSSIVTGTTSFCLLFGNDATNVYATVEADFIDVWAAHQRSTNVCLPRNHIEHSRREVGTL
jgi:hypothetical protein